MKVNGAAARLVHRGDTIIVISYAQYDERGAGALRAPRRPRRGRHNRIIDVDAEVATLLTLSASTTADKEHRHVHACPPTSTSRPTRRACR